MPTNADGEAVTSTSLEMFSLADLIAEIESKCASARATKPSWQRLLKVARDMQNGPTDDSDRELLDGRTWSLTQVRVRGFRGVLNAEPLTLDIDPTPGVTVLHGPNGSGKSSISEAVEVVLSGQVAQGSTAGGGKRQLWEPVRLGRGQTTAEVSVTLRSGSDRLEISCELASGEELRAWTCQFWSGSVSKQVELGATWSEALRCHHPVVAYATLERRVQVAGDLAQYFDQLLALGGAFTALNERIFGKSETARLAKTSWAGLWSKARTALVEVDADYDADGPTPRLPVIATPEPNSDPDEWAHTQALDDSGAVADEVKQNDIDEFTKACEEALQRIGAVREAEGSALAGLRGALRNLQTAAQNLDDPDGQCPVCGQNAPGWHDHLNETVTSLDKLNALDEAVTVAVGRLGRAAASILSPALSVASSVFAERSDLLQVATEGQGLCAAILTATQRDGSTSGAARAAAEALATWQLRDDVCILFQETAKATDRLRQWRARRALAVVDFLSTWRETQQLVAQAQEWAETKKQVEVLRTSLRARRAGVLQTTAGLAVSELIGASGVKLVEVTAQTRQASMQLEDGSGHDVELGMLSAGQRNAVLLAPLLASVDGGPFGFLILDDPVHALDEVRVDRLARELVRLADKRRVIVLTHDERLREHLRGRSRHCSTHAVHRSAADGEVSVDPSATTWQDLLTDAATLVNGKELRTSLGVTRVVRGLCRQALDGAIRDFVLAHALAHDEAVEDKLAALDELNKTKDRLSFGETLDWDEGGGHAHPVKRARGFVSGHLHDWNRASHPSVGDCPPSCEPAPTALLAEIEAARKACVVLAKARE